MCLRGLLALFTPHPVLSITVLCWEETLFIKPVKRGGEFGHCYNILCLFPMMMITFLSYLSPYLSLPLSSTLSRFLSPSVYFSPSFPPFSPSPGSSMDSPQLSPFPSKDPLCLSPSFQMSTLSLPGQGPSPLQSPILSEVGTARLDEDEDGRRKVHHPATLSPGWARAALVPAGWKAVWGARMGG